MTVLERARKWWSGEGGAAARALATDETARLSPGRGGLSLRVASGRVLVTQSGDPEDHVLARGECLRLAGRGRVVAWALEPSVLIVAPEARAVARAAAV